MYVWVKWTGSSLALLTHWDQDKMAATLADDIFKCIFLIENVWILIRISLKFVPEVPIYHKPTLVQIMAWRLLGAKPLYELMMAYFTDANMRYWRKYASFGFDELIPCHLSGTKPSP